MTLRRVYGAGPLQLLSTLASFALIFYAFTKVFAGAAPINALLWFVGAVIAHDLIAFPIYMALDRLAGRVHPPAINHLRVPALLSAISFLVFFPLILGRGGYEAASTLSTDVYLGRWLLICAGLFLGSALLYALRARRRHSRSSAE